MTLAAIGAQFNMSRQGIHSIVKDAEALLREYLEDMERLKTMAEGNHQK